MDRLGLALFGLGRIGRIHLRNILSNSRIELLYIVEQDVAAVSEVLADWGVKYAGKISNISETDEVLSDKRLDAVVICTPTDTHVPLSMKSLQSGKHVLCEKPLSEVTSEIRECFDVAEKNQKVLLAAFNRKFDASYKDMYTKVRRGDIGDILMIRSTFRDTPLWLGANTLSQTFLCHDVDILSWFNDSLPETVVCMSCANYQEIKEKGDVDCVVVTMKFPNGSIGVLDFSRYSCYGYDIRLEVFGSKGMLKMEPTLQTTVQEYTETGKRDSPFCVSFPDRFKEAYVAELNHFVDVIQGRAELEVLREHSERVSIILDAIKKSHETGQVVHL